jgi:hypothetical protein
MALDQRAPTQPFRVLLERHILTVRDGSEPPAIKVRPKGRWINPIQVV